MTILHYRVVTHGWHNDKKCNNTERDGYMRHGGRKLLIRTPSASRLLLRQVGSFGSICSEEEQRSGEARHEYLVHGRDLALSYPSLDTSGERQPRRTGQVSINFGSSTATLAAYK